MRTWGGWEFDRGRWESGREDEKQKKEEEGESAKRAKRRTDASSRSSFFPPSPLNLKRSPNQRKSYSRQPTRQNLLSLPLPRRLNQQIHNLRPPQQSSLNPLQHLFLHLPHPLLLLLLPPPTQTLPSTLPTRTFPHRKLDFRTMQIQHHLSQQQTQDVQPLGCFLLCSSELLVLPSSSSDGLGLGFGDGLGLEFGFGFGFREDSAFVALGEVFPFG